MTTFICIPRSAADGSPVDPDTYLVDTDAQTAEAKRALRDAGIDSAEVETETSDAAAEYNDLATAQKHGREAFRQTVEMAESDDDIDLNDPMEVASLTAYGWCESEYDAQHEDALEAYKGFLDDGAEPTAEAAEAFVRGFDKARDARLAEMGEEAAEDDDAIAAGKDGLDEDEASEVCENCLLYACERAPEPYARAYRAAWMDTYREHLDDEDLDDEDSDDEDLDDEDLDDEDFDDED